MQIASSYNMLFIQKQVQNPLELYKYLITIAYIDLTTIDENATINEKQQTNKYLKGR